MDLFDAEIVVDDSIVHEQAPVPGRSSSEPLFLTDDSDDEQPKTPPRKAPTDVDKIFQENMNDEDDAPLDLAAMKRKAEARYGRKAATQYPILPSSSPGRDVEDKGKGRTDEAGKDATKKPKRKPMRLDEARLLGPDGFPQLIKDTKTFRPKGKGHEAADLNRLLQVYGFWTHKLYPKTPFQDTVDTVEKLCHKKRVQVALGVWRDEADGTIYGVKHGDTNTIDLVSDGEDGDTGMAVRPRARLPLSRQGSPIPRLPPSSPASSAHAGDMDMRVDRQPPSSAPEADFDMDDEIDLDALLEDQERRAAAAAHPKPAASIVASGSNPSYMDGGDVDYDAMIAEDEENQNSKAKVAPVEEDEDDMWARFETTPSIAQPRAKPLEDADDEEMWDLVEEMRSVEDPSALNKAPSLPLVDPSPPKLLIPSVEEEEDDLYA